MRYLAIFILFIGSLCQTNGFQCQYYNESLKTLHQYCEHYQSVLPRNCFDLRLLLPASDVLRFKIEGCNSNAITTVSADYPDLNTLDISHSKYRNLNFTSNFNHLQVLNASYNELTSISRGILQNSPELKNLDLKHNYLASISTSDFEHMPVLESVNLSDNALNSVDSKVFANLPELKTIQLNNNRLSSIPIFSHNENLQELHVLENSEINHFNCTYLSSMSNVAVYISWKYVQTFHGDQDCEGKLFRVVENSTFEGIIPISDGKYEFHANDQSFKNLSLFVAGRDSFENVQDLLNLFRPTVQKIDLSGNHIGKLNASFERFRDLHELSLSNTDLEEFDFGVLNVRNQQHLTHLDISQNNLKNVTNPYLLQYFSSLHEFNAGGNQIENANELIQYLQSTIQKLDLSGNVVRNISPSIFGKFKELREFNLSDTGITIANYNLFNPLRIISALDISHNNLSTVNLAVIEYTLGQLQNFSAADCEIQNVSNVLKLLGPSLKQLDVSGNTIGHLDNESFDMFTNLTDLNLSNTNLTSFDSALLQNLSTLKNVDLSNNKLKEIDLEALPLSLERLNLQNNELEQIEDLNQTHFPALSSLAISNNKLSCDYLESLHQEFEGIQFEDDLFNQSNGHCHSNLALIIGIIIAVIVAIVLILCLCCIIRKKMCWK